MQGRGKGKKREVKKGEKPGPTQAHQKLGRAIYALEEGKGRRRSIPRKESTQQPACQKFTPPGWVSISIVGWGAERGGKQRRFPHKKKLTVPKAGELLRKGS